jgi:serine/threonine-protein kinase
MLVAAAVLAGALLGLYLTRDTSTAVPPVTGNQLQIAIDLLQQDGFEVGEIARVRRDAARNLVLEQDPSGEASLDCGFLRFFCSKPKVELTVSAGPGQGTVPSTAGLERSAAVRKLEDAGFEATLRRASSSEVAEGLVIFSDPSAGSKLRRGSEVTITVSSGPREVSVPVLVGSQRNVAVQRIRGRGLEPSVSEEHSSQPPGTVLSQSPSAGTTVDQGSTVSIVVSSGVEKVTVPGVVGLERPDAVTKLRDAGFAVTVAEQDTEVPSQVGRVLEQSPSGGTKAESGSEVTVTVGRTPTTGGSGGGP